MTIKIEPFLEKFKNINDFEFEGRTFKTNVPSVAPKAYLTILFSAAENSIQKEIIDPIGLPEQLREFYRQYNGASLFVDLISIYGFLPHYYLLERSDWRKRLPYHFVDMNNECLNDLFKSDILVFGSYGFDGSIIFIEKCTGKVFCCIEDNFHKIRTSWPSFETWLENEMTRLAEFHDENGNRLLDIKASLPS